MTRLDRIETPKHLERQSVEPEVRLIIAAARRRIEAFQDRWDVAQIEQFVAADYELVYQTLRWIAETQYLVGGRFLEWGCGFAVVAALASRLGWVAFGIEAEPTLLRQGRATLADWPAGETVPEIELVAGNFLPPGAEAMADDPTLPSLEHDVRCGYRQLGLDLDDFAIVYSYPWPGEDLFHEQVFARYAAPGAILVQFCGPHDVRVWRRPDAV